MRGAGCERGGLSPLTPPSHTFFLFHPQGWAASAKFNERARDELEAFRERPNTFSLGICNGCQLMALMGWVGTAEKSEPATKRARHSEASTARQPVVLAHNESGCFESRYATVKILPSPAVLLRGMEGSTLGVWVAHGEGLFDFESEAVLATIEAEALAPLRYVDDDNVPTERYPLNPNGSPRGVTALCSPCGRHLAMMPHPERSVHLWQCPWLPSGWREGLKTAPWIRMFQNARAWCEETA